jgi:hypothetical protein
VHGIDCYVFETGIGVEKPRETEALVRIPCITEKKPKNGCKHKFCNLKWFKNLTKNWMTN